METEAEGEEDECISLGISEVHITEKEEQLRQSSQTPSIVPRLAEPSTTELGLCIRNPSAASQRQLANSPQTCHLKVLVVCPGPPCIGTQLLGK